MSNSKKVIITQSNYIPWKGYFDSIAAVDVFVVYDDMQYTKRDWRNRNLVKTPQGSKWMSIPVEVKGKFFQKINETKVSDLSWTKSHLGILKQNYAKTKCFKDVFPWVEELYYSCNYSYLTDINLHFIRAINSYLGITTELRSSTEFQLHEEKTQRLVNICKDVDGTDYFSGPAAKAYMDIEKFKSENVAVHFWEYSGYAEYEQLYPPFDHGVSIFDLIFNEGKDSIKYLKYLK
jgi:hypothetical protein